MNTDLLRAIADRRLIEFIYRTGTTRIVEPHDYGIRNGVESLLAYQISGESQSGASHGWKHFAIDKMRQLRVLERRFAGSRVEDEQRHLKWDELFSRVS